MTKTIPSLDGLRAVSFLIVFVAHAGLGAWVPGGFGVTIFFFLSGFLITTLMRLEYERLRSVNMKHFWLRRLLRIWPPFYLVLLTGVAAALIFQPGTLSAGAVRALLLHFTNYWTVWHGFDGQPDGTGVYWSLAIEEHFYLVFPWVYVAMQRARLTHRDQALLLWGLCALVLLWRVVLIFILHAPQPRTYLATDTRIDSILFGCALAVWNNPVIDPPTGRDATLKYYLLPAALLTLGACIVIRGDGFRETLRYSLQGAALTLVFVSAIRFQKWGAFRLLNWKPVMFLGTISYSLYLIHQTVLIKVQGLTYPHRLPQAVLSLLIATGIAWGIYQLIEKPCAKLRRQLH
jgi:peptidoglycan/LPS O-acetylase OafA/YrhL